ncbi:MAG: hypothetical protein HQL31_04720, partial [Planctomycetes bacterium]|nr:hypothetical protein [Planctomycetota bacterium]
MVGVAKKCGVGLGFHSGGGKSSENYRVCGEETGANFEIKTSGRYTYELGRALSQSSDATDHKLWLDWYDFCLEMAVEGAFAEHTAQRASARGFIDCSLVAVGRDAGDPYGSPEGLREVLRSLPPSADHMFWFEYNFLYILKGRSLGDHSPEGYRQRQRFYAISDEGRLLFAKNIAAYIIFLAESTGLISLELAQEVSGKLEATGDYLSFLAAIAPN